MVVFFGSIFSARIEMTGRTAKEKALLDAVESAIEVVRPEAQRQIKTRMFYPYISDSALWPCATIHWPFRHWRRICPSTA